VTVTIEGPDSIYFATPAFLLPEDRETAWAGAKDHVVARPDLAWIMGNFIQADPLGDGAAANTNGHSFPLADVVEGHKRIRMTPLNILHQKNHVVGTFVASELIYPPGYDTNAAPVVDGDAGPPMPFPYVEALAAMWKFHFRDEYKTIKKAHDMGMSWFSMEAVADSVTCQTQGCCGGTYAYDGVRSKTYCDALNAPRARKRMNGPYFVGGALVYPPAAPGWKRADLKSVAALQLAEGHPEEAEELYQQVATAEPALSPAEAEVMMAYLLAGAFSDDVERRQKYNVDWDAALVRLLDKAPVVPATPPVVDTIEGMLARAREFGVARDASSVLDRAFAGIVQALETDAAGAMVALVPPKEVLEQLVEVGGTEPIDQLHLTLAYLGDVAGDSTTGEPAVTKDAVCAAVAAFAAGTPTLPSAEVSGIGRFKIPEGEVTFATVDCPGLNELRDLLCASLCAAGIEVARNHGFTPHISLDFHAPGKGKDLPIPDIAPWPVTQIEVWWAGEKMQYPLGGGQVQIPDE
jgi:2'-5' RNA ligase